MGWLRGAPLAPNPAASDAALAARVQQEELLQLAAARRAQTGESSGGDADVAGKVYLDDPVWGRWVSAQWMAPQGVMAVHDWATTFSQLIPFLFPLFICFHTSLHYLFPLSVGATWPPWHTA